MQQTEIWLLILFLSKKKIHAKQIYVNTGIMKLGPVCMLSIIRIRPKLGTRLGVGDQTLLFQTPRGCPAVQVRTVLIHSLCVLLKQTLKSLPKTNTIFPFLISQEEVETLNQYYQTWYFISAISCAILFYLVSVAMNMSSLMAGKTIHQRVLKNVTQSPMR